MNIENDGPPPEAVKLAARYGVTWVPSAGMWGVTCGALLRDGDLLFDMLAKLVAEAKTTSAGLDT